MKPYIRLPLRALGFVLAWSFYLCMGGFVVYLLVAAELIRPLLLLFGVFVSFVAASILGNFILEKTE